MFKLISSFHPTGDQPKAIEKLVSNIESGKQEQILFGATGTGKTFTMANVIQQIQLPTLILAHNKTLAMQLYSVIKSLFPYNSVEYFVSFFNYFQPEAYKPTTNTYIAKKTQRNEHIVRMRLKALNSLITKKNVIVIASVAAIYGAFNPHAYRDAIFNLKKGQRITKRKVIENFNRLGYKEKKKNLTYGSYKWKEKKFCFMFAWEENYHFQITINKGKIISIENWQTAGEKNKELENIFVPPAQEYVPGKDKKILPILEQIKEELNQQLNLLKNTGKYLEAGRLEKRVNDDLLNLSEYGVCPGIENYSRFFDGRQVGECPFTLLDYFPKDFLVFIDESHITIPQIKAMYNNDRSRKLNLVNYGFRLPSCLDNRPLNFPEFLSKIKARNID